MFFLLPHFFLRFKPIPENVSGTSMRSVFYSAGKQFPVNQKGPGESPGPDTSITFLRLCRFCSELLFIIHSKYKNYCDMSLFFFVSFTLSFCLRDSQITDLLSPSAPIFGILQRAIRLQSCPFLGHLRVLFLRRAYAFFPATFYWLDIQLKCMSTVTLCYTQGQVYTPGRHLSIRGCIFFVL